MRAGFHRVAFVDIRAAVADIGAHRFTRRPAPMRYFLAPLLLCFAACRGVQQPNVLILYTDDQRYNTLHALGNQEIRTPYMDRLVREGTAFTHAHTMGGLHGALCAPSRAMLMTGRPLFSLLETGDVIPETHTMMPELFAEAGYTTFGAGKWHNDRAAYARAFDRGDNIFFGGMHWPGAGGHEAPQLHHYDSTGVYANEDRWRGEGFSSALYADAAIAFLQERREDPFLAYVSFTSPHDPRTPPAPYDSWYVPDSVSLPPNYMPEHPFDNGELRVRDEMLREHPRSETTVREELATYYGMISEVDAQIGRILDALEKSGLWDNTLIVFAGDNGLAVGSHGLLGKQNLYEHSMRVPLVLSGPGIPRHETRDALVYIHDIFPTLVDHVGLSMPATVEGSSLTPFFSDASAPGRDAVFYVYRDLQRGVRTRDNWKLISYRVEGVAHEQMFNLREDPHELHNLAEDPAHADQREELRERLLSQSRAFADPLDLASPTWGK